MSRQEFVVARLIEADKRTKDIRPFSNGVVVTGIFGTAYKI